MKALLISESDEILNSYAAFFKEAGYDTVCYRWLLKAMDNLEEIEPQLVFIDGFGYPRHWKTLAQYIKTSFKNAPLVLLAADLSEEEAKKADCLDVHCISGSIEDEQTRRDIVLLLHPEQNQAFVPSEAPATAEEFEEPEQSAFTAIAEPEKEPEVSAEPVEEIEEPEVPAAEPIQTAEPAEPEEEPEQIDAQPFFAVPAQTSLSDGDPVSACAEELAECEVEPVQPAVEQTEQSAELIAATEPAETAEPVETADFPEPTETVEPETFAPDPEISDPAFFAAIAEPKKEPEVSAEPVERFEEPEQIDDEPFFKAVPPVKISSSGASVSAAQNEEPEVTTAGNNEVFSFTFFHPRTKTTIYGSTVSFKPPLLYFKPDDSSVLRTLRFGQKSSGIINDKELASNVSVQIQGFENDSIELCLLK